jgi:hypothetical protein
MPLEAACPDAGYSIDCEGSRSTQSHRVAWEQAGNGCKKLNCAALISYASRWLKNLPGMFE